MYSNRESGLLESKFKRHKYMWFDITGSHYVYVIIIVLQEIRDLPNSQLLQIVAMCSVMNAG